MNITDLDLERVRKVERLRGRGIEPYPARNERISTDKLKMSKEVSLVEEKEKVKAKIRGVTGKIFFSHKGRKDWMVSEDGNISVFITSSSLHPSKKYWFDLSVSDVLAWDEFERAIVVFVLGSSERVLIVPANALYELVKKSGKSLKVVSDLTVKLHIERRDGEYVLHEANKTSMSKYYNKYDFLGIGTLDRM